MATYTEQMQRIWRLYEEAGESMPAQAHDVAEWAIRNKLWQPRPSDIVKQCSEDLSRSAREEYFTNARGQRGRVAGMVGI